MRIPISGEDKYVLNYHTLSRLAISHLIINKLLSNSMIEKFSEILEKLSNDGSPLTKNELQFFLAHGKRVYTMSHIKEYLASSPYTFYSYICEWCLR